MPETPPGADFNNYKAVRDEIAREDNLTGTRLNWFIMSQAFLLSALAIAHSGYDEHFPNPHNDYFFPLIPILALATCVLIMLGIIGGAVAIRRWRRLVRQMIRQDPSLPAIGRDGFIMRLGWSAPLLLPMLFLLAWSFLLVAGYSRWP